MSVKIGDSTPLLHVAESRDRSASMSCRDSPPSTLIAAFPWDGRACTAGMGRLVRFLRAKHPVDSSALAVMLCLYTPDLTGLREHPLAGGVKVQPINHPEYMPSGKINIADPDGYRIEICHWGRHGARSVGETA